VKPVQERVEQVSCDLKNVVWQVFVQEMQKNIQNVRENTSDKASVQISTSEDALHTGECIDINVDSIERLMMLPGVGEQRAKAILQARQKKSFRHKKDIRKVRGIGSKAYQKMASMICDI
jgi:competence protein ComEA